MAFSPVNQVIIAWRGTGDREMWTIDPQTGDEVSITSSFHLGFVNLEQTQGASVSYDSVTQTETLHVLVRDNGQSYVYEVDMATGSASNPVGPITGDFTRPASLAIDPSDGTWYVTKDTETRQLATLDPITAVVTTVVTIAGDPDAEGLEFADDGEIYLEEDRGSLGGRNIYQVDRTTGALTVATQTIPGSGDIEGLSCNANSTLILDPCAVVGQGNGGQGSGQIVDVSANSGDEVIAQIVLREGSSTFVYNSSSAFIRSSSNAPVLLKSARLAVGGGDVQLDEFNFSSANVGNVGYPSGITGVHTSENGAQIDANDVGFGAALARVFDGADLRDYLDHDALVPTGSSFSPDFNVIFNNPLDNADYLIVSERAGDAEFVIEALDMDGNVIANSDAVRVFAGVSLEHRLRAFG